MNLSEEDEEEDDVQRAHFSATPREGGREEEVVVEEHEEDVDSDEDDYYPAARTSVGYNSRLEKILAENKDLGITIIDAGKNVEGGGGGYIVYTIRTGVWVAISYTASA